MLNGTKILIAEDSEINYFLLKELIGLSASDHYWARNGKEALDLLSQKENISLVLMDISMPVMDGITATRKIREKEINIPIIFQTAFDNQESREQCFAAGGNEFLNKPLRRDSLTMVIKKYLLSNQHNIH